MGFISTSAVRGMADLLVAGGGILHLDATSLLLLVIAPLNLLLLRRPTAETGLLSDVPDPTSFHTLRF